MQQLAKVDLPAALQALCLTLGPGSPTPAKPLQLDVGALYAVLDQVHLELLRFGHIELQGLNISFHARRTSLPLQHLIVENSRALRFWPFACPRRLTFGRCHMLETYDIGNNIISDCQVAFHLHDLLAGASEVVVTDLLRFGHSDSGFAETGPFPPKLRRLSAAATTLSGDSAEQRMAWLASLPRLRALTLGHVLVHDPMPPRPRHQSEQRFVTVPVRPATARELCDVLRCLPSGLRALSVSRPALGDDWAADQLLLARFESSLRAQSRRLAFTRT